MSLRISRGNMYDFVSHTFNVIKGKCSHDCEYCYMKMKKFKLGKLRFDKKALDIDLGKGNFIFVGSSCDMFANDVPNEWVWGVLSHLLKFDNRYLLQSKNTQNIWKNSNHIPLKSSQGANVIGTTIETNRRYKQMGVAPDVMERATGLRHLRYMGFETMVTIEPIMDFDLKELVDVIFHAKPTWVNIGADSKEHNLPEPSKDKILELVTELNKFTEIRKKNNLGRIMGDTK